ncbi:metalloregulator ArsR/SmtB family transcription factor [Geodermatophilus sp. YIM 151500]|uniref:ArsR/SmtB family transcription factor n=1 Tax=Geodermatophilus sp. YIM 151500 TaxID=2984531 RepID=UPI0021E4F98A|nr:metalloregulator ArsR/SmtB family transcription factor [Geodermatophilus sp. YIM 151500]MCV2488421.1 metalloregulator ArsR/SmtB family transcription factor [Geodermatophilus sp. YIM 151500]
MVVRGGGYTAVMEQPARPEQHGHPLDPARVASARSRLPDREDVMRLTGLLGLIADPTRARLLYALDVVDELCVGDLALALDVSEDAASYGLRVLRTAGLVTYRRDGRVLYYRLAEGFPEPLRRHCLGQLVELSKAAPDDEGAS